MAQLKLTSFYGKFQRRTDSLLNEILIAPPNPAIELNGVSVDKMLAQNRGYLINRLFHLWGEFCMHVVVFSTLGKCRTLNGSLLRNATGIANQQDILHKINAKSITGPGMRWGDPKWTAQNAKKLQPVNLQQITLGLGVAPYNDFRRVRNFVIHSNKHTRGEFNKVALAHALFEISTDDLLLHKLPGGATLMESWVLDFQIAALDAIR